MKAKGLPSRPTNSQISILLSSQSGPLWLQRLCYLEGRFTAIALVLATAMLTAYGWAGCTQHEWSQQYRKLASLQRHERQLTTTNEMLKNQMALQAEKQATGLVPPKPANLIFLKPAAQRPDRAIATALPASEPIAQTKQPTSIPLGY